MTLLSRPRRPFPSSLALLALLTLALIAPPAPARAPAEGRVVVLGFDGADSRTVARMIAEGALPNLAKLEQQGTFAPLVSTNPAESAAGWAAINTGTNPLENGVPSFIKRNLPSMAPGFAHITPGKVVPLEELDAPWLLSVLAEHGGAKLTAIVGGAALILSFAVLALLLKVHWLVSLLLGLVVGGAGGYAAHRAKDHAVHEVPNVYESLVSQPGFWDLAAEGGKRALVLDAALAFGRPTPAGARVLGGLGLPDIRAASNGNWFIYTTDEFEQRPPKGRGSKPSGTGTTYRVDERDGRVEAKVYGPVNFTRKAPLEREIEAVQARLQDASGWAESQELRDRVRELEKELKEVESGADAQRATLDMEIGREGEKLAITIDGQTQVVGEGEWTGWYRLAFELNPLITAHAVTRARVLSLEEPLSVYLNTLDIDPENPPFWQPVSQPPGFSAELAGWLGGPFQTLGWACQTNQIKDKELPVDVFLEEIQFTMGWRRRLTQAALGRDDWDLLFSVFSTTDRVQHIMYRYHDPEHPRYEAEEAARKIDFFGEPVALADTIPAVYRQMDAIVGEVLDVLAPEDTLLICADHGFTSFRREVDVNNWLLANGYLKLKDGFTGKTARIYKDIDWSGTRAYALGLGMVYANVEGREPQGIVPLDEARALLEEIGQRLMAEALDPGPEDAPYDEPRPAVMDFVIVPDLYSGPEPWGSADYPCADMQLGFAEYYRTSWSGVGGDTKRVEEDGELVAGPVFRDNTNNWSGDHASNSPELVTGTFFSSRPVVEPEGGVSVMHIAPTVLELLGVARPASLDLPPLEHE